MAAKQDSGLERRPGQPPGGDGAVSSIGPVEIAPVLDPEIAGAFRTLESIVQRDLSTRDAAATSSAVGVGRPEERRTPERRAGDRRVGDRRAVGSRARPTRKRRWIAAAEVFAIATVLGALVFGRKLFDPPFELRAEVGGVEAPLAGARLGLGPKRDRASIRVLGLDPSVPLESVRLVTARRPSAPAVVGFTAILQRHQEGDPEIVIRRTEDPVSRARVFACLEVRRVNAETSWSEAFDLVWLDDDAWSLESVAIENLGRRAVDPYDVVLEIAVRGDRANLAGVRVEHGGVGFPALRDVARSRGEHNIYLLPLRRSLDLPCGAVDLHIVVTDLAHRTAEATFTARYVSGPLLFERVELDSTSVGGLYFITAHEDRRLRVVATRKCNLTWTVRDEAGTTRMTGSAEGVGEGTYLLAGLTTLADGKPFSGSIEVEADESAYVLHSGASRRGVATGRLRFTCSAP